MPCSPNDNSLNISAAPGISIPGFGSPFSPLQIPLPAFDLPTELIEDLLNLMRSLGALFPSGLFKPNMDNFMKDILDAIMSVLNQVAPYISLYNLFSAVLNLIVCIIEVICAFPNPIAIAFKLKKLFAECLPPFINILPWLALLAMIIALLLLILQLIQYIIATILKIIEELLANLILLGKALTLDDDEVTLAIAQKIAALFCFIENLMAIFIAIAAIMAIVEALAKLAGVNICSDSDADEFGCCTAENCPSFIKNNPDGVTGTQGRLVYHSKINSDIATLLGVPAGSIALDALRPERWQFLNDASSQTYPFSSIVTPVSSSTEKIYFPDTTFDETTPKNRSPYLVDLRFKINPIIFNSSDIGGNRYMRVTDCIVTTKPLIGEYNYANTLLTTNSTGTLFLEGGKVYEDDGSTAYIINTKQASLNDFIHLPDSNGIGLPVIDDGYTVSNVEFTWKMNHEALMLHNLITVGCFPGVGLEKEIQNAIMSAEGIEAVVDKLQTIPDGTLVSGGTFPNILGAQTCVLNSLNTLRKNITAETVADFSATMQICLGDLNDQTSFMYCDALIAATSQYKSTMEIDIDIQFLSEAIELKVILKDPAGTILSTNIPDSCIAEILDKLKATITFGNITDFIYDGTNAFLAYITADSAGSGTITVSFNNKIFSVITVGTTLDTATSISTNILSFTFVDAVKAPAVRRDETDVANDKQ